MALGNYTDLQDDIVTHAVRTGDADFVAKVPSFIALAHSEIQLDLRCRDMETTATVTMTSGSGPLPTDYLEFIEVKEGTRVLDAVEPNFGDSQYPNGGSAAKRFAILGSTITTYPPASSNLTLRYYQQIEALPDSSTGTNWVLTKYPGLYLYGALLQAEPYMADDPRMATWGTMYANLLSKIVSGNTRSKFARASSRVRSPTP